MISLETNASLLKKEYDIKRHKKKVEGENGMDMTEKMISRQTIHKGKITEYTLEEVLLPNGENAQREIVRHAAASAVLPIMPNGNALFVKQFRKPLDRTLIEIPAGLIDPEDEDELAAAKRELLEETGYQANEWQMITSFYSSPGFTDECLYLFTATDLIKETEILQLDEGEFLEVMELSFEEAWRLYEKKEIQDAKSVFALFYWKSIRIGK